ncbi:hypothetical protein [Bordetella avium]|uniref:hypothetical protein n=1 Tax=Bordetella avium TaxID=521 RepID=UPI000FD7E87A|nr:hypothetical protein [Bordetella avium]
MDVEKPVSCVCAIGVLALVPVAIAFALNYPDGSSEWAAWVQAFGSICAVMGAVYAAREGARASARIEDERREKGVLALVQVLSERMEAMSKAVSRPDESWMEAFEQSYVQASLDGTARALQGIPPLLLPTAGAIEALLELQSLLPFVIVRADELGKGPWHSARKNVEELEKLRAVVESWEKDKHCSPEAASEHKEAVKQLYSAVSRTAEHQKQNLLRSTARVQELVKTLCRELGASHKETKAL